jgi:hypothetical protein
LDDPTIETGDAPKDYANKEEQVENSDYIDSDDNIDSEDNIDSINAKIENDIF